MTTSRRGHGRFYVVMAGLVPAIHVFDLRKSKTWMPATSAGMTSKWDRRTAQIRPNPPLHLRGLLPAVEQQHQDDHRAIDQLAAGLGDLHDRQDRL